MLEEGRRVQEALKTGVPTLSTFPDTLERPSGDELVGAGLRSSHYARLLDQGPGRVAWFEAITENYMNTGGRPLDVLLAMRAERPLALHGVSLSIGRCPDPRDPVAGTMHRQQRDHYLGRLAAFPSGSGRGTVC